MTLPGRTELITYLQVDSDASSLEEEIEKLKCLEGSSNFDDSFRYMTNVYFVRKIRGW